MEILSRAGAWRISMRFMQYFTTMLMTFITNLMNIGSFSGYDYTRLFNFYRGLYGGSKLQNHALNSRVNGEFKNKIVRENDNDLIIINNGRYALHIDYLYD